MKVGGQVPAAALDLLRIAAYAYWADQMVTRPAETDVTGRTWERRFTVCAPECYDLWVSEEVQSRLKAALDYGTGDHWEFRFERRGQTGQGTLFDVDPASADVSTVLMFSGGLDSTCAAIEEAELGRNPLLVSHAPSTRSGSRQDSLARQIRERFSAWRLPRVSVDITKQGVTERERTQRSRGFLYASTGAAVAAGFGLSDVVHADNGWVSVGLPLSGQAIGTKMSRTTHPRFHYLFNRLLDLVLPGTAVRNPLLFRTRGQALEILKRHHATDLIGNTHSCAASGRLQEGVHCGVCSQCIDRRIAVGAAELRGCDVVYKTDVFLDDSATGPCSSLKHTSVSCALSVLATPSSSSSVTLSLRTVPPRVDRDA